MQFPTTCIDNFYKDPYKIREMALSLPFKKPEDGSYPGKRTQPLHLVDPKFFEEFCAKLLSVFFDFKVHDVKYQIVTTFQLIEPLATEKASLKNKGWVHYDEPFLCGGVIYLNPEFDFDSGTSIYLEKEPDVWGKYQKEMLTHDAAKSKYYLNEVDDEFDYHLNQNNGHYIETAKYSNVFNRLIAIDGKTAHAANNMYSTSEPRLTQTFFVEKLEVSASMPIERLNRFSL